MLISLIISLPDIFYKMKGTLYDGIISLYLHQSFQSFSVRI